MGRITLQSSGDFSKLKAYLYKNVENIPDYILEKYGQEGVTALAAATPKDTGATASSWAFKIVNKKPGVKSLVFYNTNKSGGMFNDECCPAILVQYGHATKSGTWVEGIDYINPALQPIFKNLSERVREELNRNV